MSTRIYDRSSTTTDKSHPSTHSSFFWSTPWYVTWIGTVVLCIALILVGYFLYRPIWHLSIDVGNESAFTVEGQTSGVTNYYGYQDAERVGTRTFRRASERAALSIPAGLRIASPLAFNISACGCYEDQTEGTFQIITNGTPTIVATAQNTFRQYTVLLPTQTSHPAYDLLVDIHSPTWKTTDGRSVGIAIDRMGLRQTTQQHVSTFLNIVLIIISLPLISLKTRSLWATIIFFTAWLIKTYLIQPQYLPFAVVDVGFVLGFFILSFFAHKFEILYAAFIATWLSLSSQILGHWVVDDAYISFRYAQQFVRGNGIVFNVGEYVEGYTNFLWTMVMSISMAMGFNPALFSSILTFALGFAILLLTIFLAKQLVSSYWAWPAAILVSLTSPFLLYTTRGSGMETALFAVLLLCTILALVHRAWALAGLFTTLTLMTRPDGILLALVGGLFVVCSAAPGFKARIRAAVAYSSVIGVLYVPYFAWRWWYYGYPLPNTFYAKVGESGSQIARGLTYVGSFAATSLLLVSGIGGALVSLWLYRKTRDHTLSCGALLTAIVLIYSAYVIYVGGDWMPGFRFGMPLLPICAVLTVWGAETLARRRTYATWICAPLTLLLMVALVRQLPQDSAYLPTSRVWAENNLVARYREIGRWLAVNTPPHTTVAVSAAGVMPYYADRPALDVLGLNDEYIAHLPSTTMGQGKAGHEKTDPGYVLNRRPEIIPWVTAPWVIEHPLFDAHYHLTRFAGPEGRHIQLFVRNDVSFESQTP